MNKFSWYEAKSVDDALKKVNTTVSKTIQANGKSSAAVFKAGGVDLFDLMKEGLSKPDLLIDINNIPGMEGIEYDSKTGLKIKANTKLSDIESAIVVKDKYYALYQAIEHAGTPQIRNTATLGGNLVQRTRCWYFRNIDTDCYRKGSGTCFAQEGENEFHAIIGNQPCASVHASSVSTALMAFNARVVIASSGGKRREVEMVDFFVHPEKDSSRECVLETNELITEVIIPAVNNTTKSYYIKQGARESYDWAIADVAVVTELSGSTCKSAEIVLGAAAPIPIKAGEAAQSLKGKKITESSATKAGDLSMKDATPLSKNAYKVPLFKSIVKRAILKTV